MQKHSSTFLFEKTNRPKEPGRIVMCMFNGFGLLLQNAEGKWEINGVVINSGERVKIEGFWTAEDAAESRYTNRDFEFFSVVSIDKAFVWEDDIVCFDISGPFEEWEPTRFYAYRAQRMVA